MTTDSGDSNAMICYNNNNQNRRNNNTTKVQTPGGPPPEQEQLPCPRCHSTNTKFCYYNNYNFSQPRHFCKSCRRYWTHGGTLRDIPVGGGTRKSAKRSRPTTTTTTAAVPITSVSSTTADAAETKNMMMNAVSAHHGQSIPIPSTPIFLPLTHGGSVFCGGGDSKVGTFTSLLDNQGPGFLALGGFGLGIGAGYEEVGFGLSRGGGSGGGWPFSAVSEGGACNGGPTSGLGHTWQFENGESGYVNGDCCSAAWPDLAISTPGNGLK